LAILRLLAIGLLLAVGLLPLGLLLAVGLLALGLLLAVGVLGAVWTWLLWWVGHDPPFDRLRFVRSG
jgi:hypothetical protein